LAKDFSVHNSVRQYADERSSDECSNSQWADGRDAAKSENDDAEYGKQDQAKDETEKRNCHLTLPNAQVQLRASNILPMVVA